MHSAVPAIRTAMREVSFRPLSEEGGYPCLTAQVLEREVCRLWLLWHSSPNQRTEVGRALPRLIRQAHSSIRSSEGDVRRACRAATADIYRLVQRMLAHICEPELHELAVERGRALSEEADRPGSLAEAAWASSVGLCAGGYYDDAAELAHRSASALLKSLGDDLDVAAIGTLGALQLEAAAAHGLAGREGDAYRYLDAAAATAGRMSSGSWHLPSAFNHANVDIMAVIVGVSLHRNGEAVARAKRLNPDDIPSVVRRSRLFLEVAQAHSNRHDGEAAVRALETAVAISPEAVGLIPWARSLADELADGAPLAVRNDARRLAAKMKAIN